jgi:hypothetical protein
MSGWIFLVAGLVIGAGDFVIGYRFTGMTGEQLERLSDGSVQSPEGIQRVGRIVMLLAPIFFLVFAALAFGWIPTAGIEPIRLAR